MLYDAGAKEVHLGISCPPIKFPDFYGIDTPESKELLAYKRSVNQMCKFLGAKSLFFFPLKEHIKL